MFLTFNIKLLKNNKFILTINLGHDIVMLQNTGKWQIMTFPGNEVNMAKEDKRNKSLLDLEAQKQALTRWTKYLLDFMFYAGIVVTISLPFSIHWIGTRYLPPIMENYQEIVIIYFVLGVSAAKLIWELRKIFKTVLAEDCFVMENVVSLQKMGNWSFFIAGMSVVRSIVYATIAMAVVILVFLIAGLFSKVLALVFEEAVRYKEENDLTI